MEDATFALCSKLRELHAIELAPNAPPVTLGTAAIGFNFTVYKNSADLTILPEYYLLYYAGDIARIVQEKSRAIRAIRMRSVQMADAHAVNWDISVELGRLWTDVIAN